MLDFLKRNQLRIAIIITFITIFFVIANQTGKERINNWFISVSQAIIYPFQYSFHTIETTGSGIWNNYFWLVGVVDENQELKKRINQLVEENSRYIETAQKYKRLQKFFKISQGNSGKRVFAEVIAEGNEGHSKILIINKGRNSGIKTNCAVMTPEGMVGKIIQAGANQAQVQLITDPRSQFPVLIQRTRTKAILEGTSGGNLKLTMVPRRDVLEIGDRVVTSGLAGIFPRGLLAGAIRNIHKNDVGLFQEAEINSAVDFSRIEEVFVILDSYRFIHPTLFKN